MPASIHLRKLVLCPTGLINLGIILREDLLLCSSYLPLGVPTWGVIYTPSAPWPTAARPSWSSDADWTVIRADRLDQNDPTAGLPETLAPFRLASSCLSHACMAAGRKNERPWPTPRRRRHAGHHSGSAELSLTCHLYPSPLCPSTHDGWARRSRG
jgi:hypothetical protein